MVSKGSASAEFFVFVARAMAAEFFFKVVAGHHFGFGGALGKDHPDELAAGGASLQGKGGARLIPAVGPVEIDGAFFHDLANFFFADLPAVHATERMFGVNQRRRMTVECLFFLGLVPAANEESHENESQE